MSNQFFKYACLATVCLLTFLASKAIFVDEGESFQDFQKEMAGLNFEKAKVSEFGNTLLTPLPNDPASLNDRGLIPTSIRIENPNPDFKLLNQAVLGLKNAARVASLRKQVGMDSFDRKCRISLSITLAAVDLKDKSARLRCQVTFWFGPAAYVSMNEEVWEYKNGTYRLIKSAANWAAAG